MTSARAEYDAEMVAHAVRFPEPLHIIIPAALRAKARRRMTRQVREIVARRTRATAISGIERMSVDDVVGIIDSARGTLAFEQCVVAQCVPGVVISSAVRRALIDAARRGARVRFVIDAAPGATDAAPGATDAIARIVGFMEWYKHTYPSFATVVQWVAVVEAHDGRAAARTTIQRASARTGVPLELRFVPARAHV